MTEGCALDLALARKVQTNILQRLATVGQRPVAELLDVSEATVSRLKSEQLETFARFLAALGVKVVPVSAKCFAPEYVEHLQYFARIGMAQVPSPILDWEGDE